MWALLLLIPAAIGGWLYVAARAANSADAAWEQEGHERDLPLDNGFDNDYDGPNDDLPFDDF